MMDPEPRTGIQRLFLRLLPREWGDAMRRDSLQWRVRCLTCDTERSVWEAGGIRWGARSLGKRTMVRCSTCDAWRSSAVEKMTTET